MNTTADDRTIEATYSCALCGLSDVPVTVRARRADEDVGQWFDRALTPALGADHHRRSPGCRPRELKDVKIPIPPGVDRVGALPEH